MNLAYRMKTHKNFKIIARSQTNKLGVTLSIIFLLLIPMLGYGALQETQAAEQEASVDKNTPESSSETENNGEKSLANEPESLGRLLYENHCLSCHESMVHIRNAHKAKTFTDVQYWVGRWAQELEIKWSADEIDAVVQHLNDTFYHY